MPRIPWAPRPGDRYDYRSDIPALIMEGGRIQAEGKRRSGDIWGSTVARLGDIAADAIRQHSEAQREKAAQEQRQIMDAAFVKAVETWDGQDPKALLTGMTKILGTKEGPEAARAVLAFHGATEKDDTKNLGVVLGFAAKQSDEVLGRWYPELKQRFGPTLAQIGLPAEALPEAWSPEARPGLEQLAGLLSGAKPKGLTEVSPSATLYDEASRQAVFTAPGVEKPPQAPATLDAALLEAHRTGNQAEVNRLLDLSGRKAAATRPPEKAEKPSRAGDLVADAWAEGKAFPTTQEATTAALESFSRRGMPVPRRLSVAQQTESIRNAETIQTIEDVESLYEKVKGKVGPVAYRFAEFKMKLPGVDSDPDFVEFTTMLRGMGNLEIKRITGAQMSEPEAGRLLKAMATGDIKGPEFEAALRTMKRNARRSQDILLYGVAKPRESGGSDWQEVGGVRIRKVNP